MTNQTKKRAVLYARFSSDVQKDRSIDDQFALCRQVAKRDNLTVVDNFHDRAKSGATMFDKDGLRDLMQAAERKKFDVVVVESLDRLARSQVDMPLIFEHFEQYGIEINTANEGIATPMHVGMRGIMGEFFLRDLSAKVKRGLHARAREGKFPGKPPYGYRTVLGKPGEIEVVLAEAKVIDRFYREYVAGVSPRSIATGLNLDGIPGPSGRPWRHQAFIGGRMKRGMLDNQLYAGKLVYGTTTRKRNRKTGRRKCEVVPEAEHIVCDVPHLRIVDQKLFDAAQKVRRDRGACMRGPDGKVTRRNPISHADHLLGGLLRCGACGSHMRIVQTVKATGLRRVMCAAAHSDGTRCDNRRSYNLRKLTAAVVDGMRERLLQPKLISEAIKAARAQFEDCGKKDSRDLSAGRRQLEKLKGQIARLIEAVTESEVPVKALVEKLEALQGEQATVAEQVRLLEAKGNVVALHPKAVETYCKNIAALHRELESGLDECTADNRAAFRNVFDSIVVHPHAGGWMPYEITPYARLTGMLGVDPAPKKAGSKPANGGAARLVAPPTLAPTVCLGRWLKRAG